MPRTQRQQRPKTSYFLRVLLTPLIPLVLLVAMLYLVAGLLYGVALQFAIWACWRSRGVNVLLVYSDSPNWHDYVEAQLLPRLPRSTVVLNWSKRRDWPWLSLSTMAFRFFGGYREFNPLVIVFRPLRWAKTFRFYRAFKDYKHGKPRSLNEVQQRLFQNLKSERVPDDSSA